MQHPLVLKLRRFVDLSKDETRAVEDLCGEVSERATGEDIIRQGERPGTITLILSGIACRYKLSEEGQRQIVGMMVPGDLCDLHAFILNSMDHYIAALSPVSFTHIPRKKMLDLFDAEPRITRALWWSTLVDEGTLREWILNIATRNSYQRLAHLLSELCMRLESVGLGTSTECEINLRQEDLADAVGLGRSHVNSSLAKLQEERLVELKRNRIKVLDVERLMQVGQFNEDYLHLHIEKEATT